MPEKCGDVKRRIREGSGKITPRTNNLKISVGSGLRGYRALLISAHAQPPAPIFQARADERAEERMRLQRLRFEFRVELASEEPRMVRHFHDFNVHTIRRAARNAETSACERLVKFAIKFVPMSMALGNFRGPV